MELPSRVIKYAGVGVVIAAGLGTAAFATRPHGPEGAIPEGVRVAGMDWGGRMPETVRASLDEWRRQQVQAPLTLAPPAVTGVKKTWKLTRAELGADVDVDATLAAAQAVEHDTGFLARVAGWFSKPKTVEIAPKWKLDSTKAAAYLKKRVAPKLARAEKNARFLATKDSFRIVPEQPGTALDSDAALKAIAAACQDPNAASVELPVKTVTPHVTSADLKGIEGEVSRFETHYGETGNRAKNIATACSHINGTVLKPGDVFSYNQVVGPRDEDAGFKTAPVIVNGRLQPGMGGGVCQTSTTLYNAVLLADLKIVQRSHHAFPVHYIPAGRDATVAYGDKDFQFQNSTDTPIAIASDGEGGRVLMRIFGKKAPGREVKIERTNVSSWGPSVEIVHDGDMPAGERRVPKGDEGHAGHRVTVWRTVLVNGKQVKREVISRDHYDSFPRVIHVGTRAAAKKAANAAPSGVPGAPSPSQPGPAGSAVVPASAGGR